MQTPYLFLTFSALTSGIAFSDEHALNLVAVEKNAGTFANRADSVALEFKLSH